MRLEDRELATWSGVALASYAARSAVICFGRNSERRAYMASA